jgi:hypothetical protein
MQITASAISMTVEKVAASSAFPVRHFGFREKLSDGKGTVAMLGHEDAGVMNTLPLYEESGGRAALPGDRPQRHHRAARRVGARHGPCGSDGGVADERDLSGTLNTNLAVSAYS